MDAKSVNASKVVMSKVMEPTDANFLGKVFGGSLLALLDLTAYATASKFAETISVTASFDRVDFLEPIEVGELVTCEGHISFVGRTSMEVTIEVYADHIMKAVKRHTNTARVTMVALKDGKPCAVPRLICETREEKLQFLAGKLRRDARRTHETFLDNLLKKLESCSDADLDRYLESDSLLASLS